MRKSNLKGHIKTQHEGLCFSCDQCDPKTPYPAKLKIHIKLKHKGIHHKCDQCNFKALKKNNLSCTLKLNMMVYGTTVMNVDIQLHLKVIYGHISKLNMKALVKFVSNVATYQIIFRI